MITIVIGAAFLSLFYFIPTFFASSQRNKYIVELFLVNLLFGWTIVGWLGVLLFTLFWKDQWKVKWNERFVSRKRKRKDHRDLNEHFKLHDEIDIYIKKNKENNI